MFQDAYNFVKRTSRVNILQSCHVQIAQIVDCIERTRVAFVREQRFSFTRILTFKLNYSS